MWQSPFIVKTAEKDIKFGHKEWQFMIVGKDSKIITQKNLQIDSWKTEYLEIKISGEYELI